MYTKPVKLNEGWRFARGESQDFKPVTLPHDWLIFDPPNFYETGNGHYIRTLDMQGVAEGQRVYLRFDGVYMDSTLYVNGQEAAEWKYGYTAFTVDITEYLRIGAENEVRLLVRYNSPNSRWYSGAGIYRDVWLIVKNACHFIPDGIYITTSQKDGRWSYSVTEEVESGGLPYELRHALLGAAEGIRAWDIEDPILYTLRSELYVNGVLSDSEDTRFGFRTVECTTNRGFILNGRRLKLNGVCLHHDLGGFGAAVEPYAIRRQLTLLQGMGVNAVRTSHNPPAKVFMEICDEMGILVVSELLDMWLLPKTKYDYARFFRDWIERDAASWIRRDRNHPSVVMWSVGNEVYDTHQDAEKGGQTLSYLMDLVRRHDPREHAPVTFGSNYMPWENTQKCADLIKLCGYNYAESFYHAHHEAHPDWIIYGSETGSTVQSRGVYHFPLEKPILADDDLQCSVLGNSTTSWGARSVEACIRDDQNAPFSLGQFVWAGQDYIGEPTPYHTKNSYFGHIDTAGFPKDSYYIFKAGWTDAADAPFVHLFPYWDFSPGQQVDLRVCSNAPRVELFLDGESLGVQDIQGRFIADYALTYRPGTLRAAAYDETGRLLAETTQSSFGDALSLHTETESWGDLRFVTITARDASGHTVENANHRVRVCAENGTLLFLDNGDSTDYEPYQNHSRRMFSGKLLAVVRAAGEDEVRVHCEADTADVPVRKVELSVHGSEPYEIRAALFPANATHRELRWRLTDAGGIDSPLGQLEVAPDGLSAKLFPKGDGKVYVRAMPMNGKEHPALIFAMDLTLSGYGTPFLDPYSFVSGGLYAFQQGELTNGNDRGVATARDGECHIGFSGLDFGAYGADEIIVPLFPLSGAPFDFDIWEGKPGEGGEKLLTAHYDKGSHWNTYIEATYKLPRRVRGVTDLCFVFMQKVHVKGFVFKRIDRAYETLYAADCESIYGDSFVKRDEAVEQIGNNVTLAFGELDFGVSGAAALRIYRRSRPEKSSAQLLCIDADGETKQMMELPGADRYTESLFPLTARLTGKQKVSLVFLPGSDLDLMWIRFES